MKAAMTLAPLVMLFVVALGCGSSGNNVANNQKRLDGPTTPKVLVQSEPKGKTGVYQQNFRILPDLNVDGKVVSAGSHAFTISSMGNFSGKPPKCDANSLALTVSHETISDADWRFPSSTAAAAIVDGSPVQLKVYSQLPYTLPSMANYLKDPKASESLIISPTCEAYQQMARAKSLGFRIGNASFDLDTTGANSFREFAAAVGIK